LDKKEKVIKELEGWKEKLQKDLDSKTREVTSLIAELKETRDSRRLAEEELKREQELRDAKER
jgi:peptidoglycan hydrolase CwlO-like protein